METPQKVLDETLNGFSFRKSLVSETAPDVVYNLSFENAFQRNLQVALDGADEYSSMVGVVSTRGGWKHLGIEKRLKDAESILHGRGW